MKYKGFSTKWISWIQNLLTTGTSFVLLNGNIGKPFTYKRGVRQGDPLSPLLFVLAADLLQTMINRAWQIGVLRHPLNDSFGGDFPIIQYADDTLLILPGDARILFNLKGLLRTFFDSTGLHVNFSKSNLVPINMSIDRANHLASTFGCRLGEMPFTYLGLPLGTTKLTINEFAPLLNKVERGLSGISKFLNYSGRLLWSILCFQPYLPFICAA
jgi:hypothetical protein